MRAEFGGTTSHDCICSFELIGTAATGLTVLFKAAFKDVCDLVARRLKVPRQFAPELIICPLNIEAPLGLFSSNTMLTRGVEQRAVLMNLIR